MENKETMNLQQKLIAISNEMPKLLKKHYSDEVDYDFVKIDDIFELLNPAFTKHHICLQELEETDAAYSKVDASWIYTAKLTFFIVNADCPEEKERVSIQLVGDHLDSPAKAKGAAWTYGFKYFFLYKFRMKQETEDPDMKGTPNGPDRGNTQGKKSELPAKVQKPDSKGADIIADSPLSKIPVQESKKAKSDVLTDDDLPDPADFLKEEQTEERDGEVKVSEEKLSEEPSFQEPEASNQPVAEETEAFKENLSDFSEEENLRNILPGRFRNRKNGAGIGKRGNNFGKIGKRNTEERRNTGSFKRPKGRGGGAFRTDEPLGLFKPADRTFYEIGNKKQ